MTTRQERLHERVEAYVRERIASGAYGVGGRLPSTSELAAETGTSVCTVQTALARLQREGLLDRKTRRGTFVRSSRTALGCAGIYFNSPFFKPEMHYFRALGLELQQKLTAEGIKAMVWSDDRPAGDQNEQLPGLKRAIEKREIQALIAPLIARRDHEWLSQLRIPLAVRAFDSPHKYTCFSDLGHMAWKGLEELRRDGCNRIGVISNLCVSAAMPDALGFAFHRAVVEAAGTLGIELRNNWLRFPERTPASLVAYGYEQFHALWNLDARPEGLLVYPDTAVSGVITALLERRVDVPRELKLVFHAHDVLPYPCPLDATFLVSHVGADADELIRLVVEQVAGRDPQPRAPKASVIRSGAPHRYSPSIASPAPFGDLPR